MARDINSRRLHKFWWVLAFTLGSAAGALALSFFHAEGTFWITLFLAAIAGAVAILELFGDPRSRGLRAPSNPARWGGRGLPSHPPPVRKPTAVKRPARRAQLHAISGKKNVEPPSSGTS